MAFQDRRYDRGPREMHKAICADCKKECEVPFKPRDDRPVYCRDCFPKHKDSSRR
jgi:CxxC-x17-CxxC domain-containing protein